MALSAIAVRVFALRRTRYRDSRDVPAGLPPLRIPHFPLNLVPDLLGADAGLAVVTFSSMMLTSRSFAAKNRYEVDGDKEFAALGAANNISALSRLRGQRGRFSNRGGRTQITGLVAAAAIALVLLFLTAPLRFVPLAALGAVLVKAALSLIDQEWFWSLLNEWGPKNHPARPCCPTRGIRH
jgi:MFS superfamily sulfate permease-like transporter